MRCRPTLTRVDALRTGELPKEEHRAVEEHLKTCKSCEESATDVGELAQAVKALRIEPPRSLRESVRMTDFYDRVEDVWVAFSDRTIRMISGHSLDDLRQRYGKRYGRTLERATVPEPLRKQVIDALHGAGVDKPAVDLSEASELERSVAQALLTIPRGEVRSYSWLAQQVGKPKAVRAVANYVARNVVPFVVPCHRVVPAAGGVGKYGYGPKMKRDLLQREGVDVDQLDALAREGIRFVGSRTTRIFCCPTCRDARRIREENRVPFHDADEATGKGFRPCRRCQPAAA
ncbi:MAG TPA: methylated-DNA--[protein]-cysteine S-methyltransferase [Thermoanaerobaculia bacterium]|nr:methylated-DNA--[protein]-cysteine S-methyltransferase [Thermoanaerobaculia bacterium]